MLIKSKPQIFIALFLVLFIDGMGQGIFFPILTKALLDPATATLLLHATDSFRHIIYSIIIASFFICWFFGAAILGDLSDSSGRKKALLICLAGSALGYLISAIGFIFHSISLIIIGRCIDGFTAGSQPIAQAAMIDIGDPNKKASNVALILLAVSSGLISGPIIGGIFSSVTTPLYIATILAIINIILLQLFFTETGSIKNTKLNFSHAIDIFLSAFRNKSVRVLALIFLLFQSAWANIYTFLPILLPGKNITLIYAVLGLGLAIGFGFITRILESFSTSHYKSILGYGFMIIFAFGILWTSNLFLMSGLILLSAIMVACGYSYILTIISEAAGSDKQGWVMGITGTINAVAFGLVPLLTGLITSHYVNTPLFISLTSVMIGAGLLLYR